MNGAEFWALIEESARHTTNQEERTDWLVAQLAGRSIAEILDFDVLLGEVSSGSMTWLMWGAAERILGFCSDDSFTDFRCWLIGLGQSTYDRVRDDPDALAELPRIRVLSGRHPSDWAEADWPAWEELSYAASCAFEQSAVDSTSDGYSAALANHPRPGDMPPTLIDERWDFDSAEEAARRLPRLTALFPETERQRRRRLEREQIDRGRTDSDFFFGNG